MSTRRPAPGTTKERLTQCTDDPIDDTDAHIDQPVYELYGLTDEESAIMEGTTGWLFLEHVR
jgi:hypothetical protein